ncbi:MAG TPA: flagellar hook-associated protein FlgK [Acidimicrobiales bacterium]|nr:flagellar hook-associated protein FlgK [Acidimicrobiales bacterium]
MPNIGLNIAASGVDAAQTAMDTIAQNLSNANSPGYVAETANLTTNPGGDVLGVGDGVRVTSVSQANDTLLVNSVQQSQGAVAQSSALQQMLQQAQLAFQEPSSSGVSADLSSFWQAWDNIAKNPTDPAARQQVVDLAQNLVTDFNQANQQLQTTSDNASTQLGNLVTEANQLLGQVATINSQIYAAQKGGGSPNSLIDQRNQLMSKLATDIGATGSTQADGTFQVKVGGVTLVAGGWYDQLKQVLGTPESLVTKTSGVTLPASAGTAAGLLAGMNSYIGGSSGYRAQLATVEGALANSVNTALGNGVTTTGASGSAYPLFQTDATGNWTVNQSIVSDPSLIAAASSTSTAPVNDGSNAQAIANMWDSATGPDAAYRNLVQQVGDQVSSVNNQVQAQTGIANAAQQNLQAVTGVDPNQQLVSLMNFQQAYQASAKVISTVDSAMQALMAAV